MFHSAESVEKLLAYNGKPIRGDGTRLKVELSPQLINLTEIIVHVAETLESQPNAGQDNREG